MYLRPICGFFVSYVSSHTMIIPILHAGYQAPTVGVKSIGSRVPGIQTPGHGTTVILGYLKAVGKLRVSDVTKWS
jgi:hypothetical protein